MNQKILNIIIIGLLIYLLYNQYCIKKEQFSYQEPTQAIKNLGKLAKKLTTGGLTIPGNVNITGNLNVGIPDKNSMYNGTINAKMFHGDTCYVNHVNCTKNVKANMLHGDTCYVNNVKCTGDVKAKYITAEEGVNPYNTAYDTRNDNYPPIHYRKYVGHNSIKEFKIQDKIGLSGSDFCVLETFGTWDDNSGGSVKQVAYTDDTIYYRYSRTETEWYRWKKLVFSNSAGNVAIENDLYVGRQSVLKNGDMINLNQNNKNLYLNATARDLSASKPNNYRRWAYLSSNKDGGQKFKIEKD